MEEILDLTNGNLTNANVSASEYTLFRIPYVYEDFLYSVKERDTE